MIMSSCGAQKRVEASYSTREGEMHSNGCGNKDETLIYDQKSQLLAKSSTWYLLPLAIQEFYFIPRF